MTSKVFDWFALGLNGFLMLFFILYIGKFGLVNLIFDSPSKWKMIFNIGVCYVLTMYCADKFFEQLSKLTSKAPKVKHFT